MDRAPSDLRKGDATRGLVRDPIARFRALQGPNPAPYLEAVDRYAKAGFDHVALHQIGQDQAGFIEFALRC